MAKQMIDVSAYGFDEVAEMIDNLASPKVQKKVGRKVVKAACKPIQDAVNNESPVGETGRLSTSSTIAVSAKGGNVTGRVQIKPKDAPGVVAVQYGTEQQDPNTFMTRAASKSKEQAIDTAAKIYAPEIEKEWSKEAKARTRAAKKAAKGV